MLTITTTLCKLLYRTQCRSIQLQLAVLFSSYVSYTIFNCSCCSFSLFFTTAGRLCRGDKISREFTRQCYVLLLRGAKNDREQTTAQTTTKTQTTNIHHTGDVASVILLHRNVTWLTSCPSHFRFSIQKRQRKPSGVVSAEVRSFRTQTAGEAVISVSQTFPAGTRAAGLIVLNPASWRHESNGITYTHAHTPEH